MIELTKKETKMRFLSECEQKGKHVLVTFFCFSNNCNCFIPNLLLL